LVHVAPVRRSPVRPATQAAPVRETTGVADS